MRNEPVHAVPKPVKDVTRTRARNNGKSAEKVVAKRLGGRRTAFSGAGAIEKGDVRVEELKPQVFVEVKYSGEIRAKDGAKSVSFQYDWVEKTVLDAKAAGCVPVIALRFANEAHTLYVTTDEYFETLIRQSQRLCEIEASLDTASGREKPGP